MLVACFWQIDSVQEKKNEVQPLSRSLVPEPEQCIQLYLYGTVQSPAPALAPSLPKRLCSMFLYMHFFVHKQKFTKSLPRFAAFFVVINIIN